MRSRQPWLAAMVIAVLAASSASGAEDVRFKVIVNPKNPVTSIDRDVLRNAYLKKEAAWQDGDTMRPVDLARRSSVRDVFTRVVLKKTPAQLKTYWSQQIFSGKGVPPPEVATPAEVTAYVIANPGAIGYVPADVAVPGTKVIEVK
jgi:ABC-type phosphate transport system substrate-binding protein